MEAAIHLDLIKNNICVPPRTQTSRSSKHCTIFRKVWSWITEVKLVGSQRSLLHDRAIKLSKAKVHVYSDPVLFLDRCTNILLSWRKVERTNWMVLRHHAPSRINFLDSTESHSSSRGVFPRTHYSGLAPRDSDKNDTTRGIERGEFKDRILFTSMYNDIDWSKKWRQFSNKMFFELSESQRFRKTYFREDIGRFSPSRNWTKMVRNAHPQAWRSVEPHSRNDDP